MLTRRRIAMMKRRRRESEEGEARLCSQRENGGCKELQSR